MVWLPLLILKEIYLGRVMTNKIAIIQFPGSNCEYETKTAIEAIEKFGGKIKLTKK